MQIVNHLQRHIDEEIPGKDFHFFFLEEFSLLNGRPYFSIDLQPETNYFLWVPLLYYGKIAHQKGKSQDQKTESIINLQM